MKIERTERTDMPYKIFLGGQWFYLTNKAIKELRDKLNRLVN